MKVVVKCGLATAVLATTAVVAAVIAPAQVPTPVEGRIAFVVAGEGRTEVAIRALVGGRLRRIVVPRYRGKAVAVTSLAWSRRGTRLAIADTAHRILVADMSATAARVLASPERAAGRAIRVEGWSPDDRLLAISSEPRRCAAGEPRIFVVSTANGRARSLPIHPPGAAPASRLRPAFLNFVRWSSSGDRVAYGWQQQGEPDCRYMVGLPTRVMTVRATGTRRTSVLRVRGAFDARWSPDDRSLAVAATCESDEPFGWIARNTVFIATSVDDCDIHVRGVHRATFTLDPSETYNGPGAVAYQLALATREARSLEAYGDGTYLEEVGWLPGNRGVVAILTHGFVIDDPAVPAVFPEGLVLIPFDGTSTRSLPPLTPPPRMRYAGFATVGVTR